MSLGQPMSRYELRTCPKCGAQQQSPGSTICEQCGTDMRVASMQFPSQRSAPRYKVRFRAPTHLLKRTITAVVALAGFGFWFWFLPAGGAPGPPMDENTRGGQLGLQRGQGVCRQVPPGV